MKISYLNEKRASEMAAEVVRSCQNSKKTVLTTSAAYLTLVRLETRMIIDLSEVSDMSELFLTYSQNIHFFSKKIKNGSTRN